jgi:hypothetical protein
MHMAENDNDAGSSYPWGTTLRHVDGDEVDDDGAITTGMRKATRRGERRR